MLYSWHCVLLLAIDASKLNQSIPHTHRCPVLSPRLIARGPASKSVCLNLLDAAIGDTRDLLLQYQLQYAQLRLVGLERRQREPPFCDICTARASD